jgi:hypothetical protein
MVVKEYSTVPQWPLLLRGTFLGEVGCHVLIETRDRSSWPGPLAIQDHQGNELVYNFSHHMHVAVS